MAEHDMMRLEARTRELQQSLLQLAQSREFDELITIVWRKPGWTTPAEFTLVAGIVDSMIEHTKALGGLSKVLVSGSRAVGSEVAVGR